MTPGPVLLYDPDCGFCTRVAAWLAPRVIRCAVRPLSSDAADDGLDAERALREVPFVDAAGSVRWGAAAIAEALKSCRWPWRGLGLVLGTGAVQVVARPVYRWVAEHRYQLPGGSASCKMPER